MERRQFLKIAGTGTAVAVLTPTSLMTTGCSINITAAINTVLSSALAIIKVAEPGATWVTPLADAIAALEQAEATWKAGGAATVVIDALNAIQAVLAVIPATATYAPLIAILFAAIEAVMAAFGLTAQLSAKAQETRAVIIHSPYYGMAHINGPSFLHPSWQGAYKHQWNSEADELKLPQAKI